LWGGPLSFIGLDEDDDLHVLVGQALQAGHVEGLRIEVRLEAIGFHGVPFLP
jgi:hypothetical protein